MLKCNHNPRYHTVKANKHGRSVFVNMADADAIDACRKQCGNQDLLVSVGYCSSPEPSAPCTYPLHFRFVSNDAESTRKSALEASYYLAENIGVPQDCIDVAYNAGGNNNAAEENGSSTSPVTRGTGNETDDNVDHTGASNNNDTAASRNTIAPGSAFRHNVTPSTSDESTAGHSKGAQQNITTAEIVLSIPPLVFNSLPTPLMLALNHRLARQMAEDSVENVDVDIYVRDHFVPLPNSFYTATGRFVIPLQPNELLCLDAEAINELSKKQRPEDSLILPRYVPEASEWFLEATNEEENRWRRQQQFRQAFLRNGWEIPSCIRRLAWADMAPETSLEACRIYGQFYPLINAGEDEIWHHISRLARRHGIHDYPRLKNIARFGIENPAFVGCDHLLGFVTK